MENIEQETRFILKKYNISANKSLGQNFLIDDSVVDGIVKTSNICSVFDTDNDVNAANKNDYKFPEVATTVEGE